MCKLSTFCLGLLLSLGTLALQPRAAGEDEAFVALFPQGRLARRAGRSASGMT